MSLLEELEARGVTAEDLEKAASVRLFEKAAAAEGVNLDDLDENQVEELYAHFVSNTMSDADNTKEASAMNDEIVDLFEKTAAAEGIDLDEMADHELAELYNHYVENVLPEQIDEYEKAASYEMVDDAHEKLAEAEILGRHMARAYVDEMDKMGAAPAGTQNPERSQMGESEDFINKMKRRAAGKKGAAVRADKKKAAEPKERKLLTDRGSLRAYGDRLKELATGHQAAERRTAERVKALGRRDVTAVGGATDKAKKRGAKIFRGRQDQIAKIRRMERLKGYAPRVAGVAAAGGLAYGAKKMMDKESSAEEIYELAYERADDFAKLGSIEDYDGSFVDDLALDILDEHGFYIED